MAASTALMAVLGLEMTDHWLDGGLSPELAFDLGRDAAHGPAIRTLNL